MGDKRRKLIYLRVSMEDAAVAAGEERESLSIGGQRLCVQGYLAAHPELGRPGEFEELIDDGYSGTSLQRPGAQRLLELVEAGQVETVIVRDLSRLGRSYLEVGRLLEYVFPRLDVRFIAVNDHFDSAELDGSTAGFSLALRNLFNQMYSRDLSKKIKSAVDLKKRSGEYVYGAVPYGYRKGERKNTIAIDPQAAEVVRQIFQWAAEGVTVSHIARRLNAQKVTTPSEYLQAARGGAQSRSVWSYDSVRNILRNRVYTGDTVPFKSHVAAVGSKRVRAVPEEEQLVLPDTHEAIVSRELYQQARSVVKTHVKSPSQGGSLLLGYLVCGCCGKKLQKGRKSNRTFRCATPRYAPDAPCREVAVEERRAAEVLLRAVQSQCAIADAKVGLAKAARKDARARRQALEGGIRRETQAIRAAQEAVMADYERYVAGTLSREDFLARRAESRAAEAEAKLQRGLLEGRLAELEAEGEGREDAIERGGRVARFSRVTELTPALLQALVRRVVVYPGGELAIEWNFRDDLGAEMP